MTNDRRLRPEEQKFLFRLRVVAILVIIVCIAGIVFASITEEIFHLKGSEALIGILVGALMLLLQVEGARLLPSFGSKPTDEDKDER